MTNLATALGFAIVLGVASAAPSAWGQTPSEKAAAEALFQEAADLMAANRFDDACKKYQASQELDPAVGTLLRLADCYDRVGKSASAWALFIEAETVARRADQVERAEIAATRAGELKQRLSTLKLQIAESGSAPGLTIVVDKAAIPEPSWGTALPFDPGTVRIQASAPGYESWSSEVEVPTGPAETTVTIPMLERAPQKSTEQRGLLTSGSETPSAAEAPDSSLQSTLGYVAGGVGLAGLAAAGAFSYRAYTLNQDSLDLCATDDPNACTTKGKALRDDATKYGTYATIAGGVGGGLLITGLVLVLTAPSKKEAAAPRYRVLADAGPRGGSVTLRGVW
jgi:hypothetical protein